MAGVVAVAVGIVNVVRLLSAPLDAQRGHLALSVFPLVVGLWLVIGGIYTLRH